MKNEVNRALVAKKTKILKSMNLIRRGSGARLNLFRYTAMVLVLLMLGVGNAWGSTTYYSKVTTSQSPTGKGTVYVATGNTFSGTSTNKTQDVADNSTHTYSLQATPTAAGYYFVNWTSTGTATLSFNNANSAATTCSISNCSSNSNSRTTGNAQANWAEVTIANGMADPASISAEDNSSTCTANTTTITFNTKGDAKNDFKEPTWGSKTGNGSFSHTWDVASDGKVTLGVKFTGDGTYGGNVAKESRSRTTSATVTLTSALGNNKGTCTVTASFPNITIAAGEGTSFNATLNEEKQSTATFAVEYADDADDFTAEFSDETTGSTWGVDDISYADGVVTVTYTFNSTVADTHTATLTLTANDNAGGSSNTAELTAISKAKANDDASVTYNNTTTNYSTIAAAISAANSKPGAVVTLLRNIPSETTPSLSSPLNITGMMTLDLNSYTIARAGMADGSQQVITVNMSNAASVLTIKDSSVGHDGKISGTGGSNGNMLYAVCMEKGVLNFESGIVECTNTNSGDNAKATGIRVKNGCKLLMQGGTINATTSGNPARGIYATTTSSNAQMVVVSGGFINTKAANSSVGIDCESTDTPSSIDPDPTKANVILSGVTVDAQTTGTIEAIAVRSGAGVILGVQNGSYTATSKTTTAYAVQSSGHTAILGGTFNATATTTTARGLHVAGGIAAVKGGTFTAIAETDLANGADIENGAKLLSYGGTFKGRLTKVAAEKFAIGTNVKAGGALEAQGGTFIGEAANTTLASAQKAYACGVYGADGNSTINMSSATMRGEMQSTYMTNGGNSEWNGGAYGFYSRSTNPCGLTNCVISATSAYQGGFGIRFANTPAEVKNCIVTVNTTYAYNYGIFVGGSCDLKVYNSKFTCTSGTTWAYGIYAYNGTTYAENSEFNVTTQQSTATSAGDCNLYGVKVNSGKRADLVGCTINATGNGNYSNNGYGVYVDGSSDIDNCKVTVSSINTNAFALVNSGNTTWFGVASGKFSATAKSGTIVSTNGTAAATKQQLYGGYYKQNTNLAKYLPTGYGIETLPSGSTEYSEGYRYAIRATEDVGDPVCKIGSIPFTTLEEALEYASKNATSSSKLVILMVKDYTLKAGDYILPAYTTLLVPYKSDQTTAIGTTPSRADSYATRSPYRTLTFASGAKMTVYGTIEASAQQNRTDQTSSGEVRGSFGYIILNENASITLEKDAILIAWGFVCGKGTITVKDGAYAYELMSIGWYKGGNTTLKLYDNNSYKVFVITDYAYQNIECPITYHPGAQALGAASTDYFSPNGVVLVGTTNTSFFKMVVEEASADTWVRKEYDPKTDYTTWTMNNGASMSAIKLDNYSSENFYLPITSNFRIIMNYGEMNLGGDIEFHAGAELIIKKEATGKIASGKTVVFYDDEDWRTGLGSSGKYYYPVTYSPSWKAATGAATNPRLAKYKQTSSSTASEYLPDASLFIQGKLEVSGYLYTTGDGNKATANRNSNIYSSNEDAGQIIYKTAAPANTSTKTMYKCTHMYGVSDWKSITDMLAGGNSTAYPALLQNADDEYETTGGTAANSSWIYKNDHWVMVTTEGCFSVEQISGVKHYYAYPAGFVEVSSNTEDPTTHLFYDAATGERAFLKEADCTWWEVEPTPYDGNKYKCVNADHNGRYKYYEYVGNAWQEATVAVTWNIDGATTNYTVLYGTHPKYLSAAPSKAATASDYYTWMGWTVGSAEGEFYDKDAELPVVTENTTFYAYFETHKFEYTITFRSESGAVLEAKRWANGEIPTYDGTPTKTPTAAKEYTFDGWSSTKGGSKVTVAAASAATDYYAHFAESDRKYTIQWVNYNGTVLKEEQVAYNTTPSAPTTPTRPNDDYYTYTFDAWSPAVSAVTGNQTYTATYNYEKMVNKFEVLFKNGPTTIYSQNLVENTVPVFDGNEPTKDPTAQYSYTFDGWSTTNGGALAYAKNAALPALTANAIYYAHFAQITNTYKVLWKSENGKQLLETDPAVAYNSDPSFNGATPTKERVGKKGYSHDGWSATVGGNKLAELPKVKEDKVFYAHFLEGTYYDITFNANGHGSAPAGYEIIGGSKLTAPTAPTATGYTFGDWYKEAGCENVWNFASDVVTANTTLFAKWIPINYTITFDSNGGSAVESITQGYGTDVTAPAAPSKTGYTFNGWSPAVPSTMPLNGTTCVAQWTANTNTPYIVNHYKQKLNGTYAVTPDETDNLTGTTAAEVTPARKSYEGFEAPAAQTESILADGSLVVTYKYTRKSYDLSWVTDGDALTGDYTNGSTKFGAAITAPNTPTKTGYDFAGWDAEVASTMPAENTTYTATWTIKQYTLTVQANDPSMGTVTGGGLYDYNTAHTITASPKPGFKFVKWNDESTDNPRTVTVTAAVTYTATFDYDIANYTVKHWQQNIDDDDYTEVVADRQTDLSGTIGTLTNAVAKSYTGFEAQSFSQGTIAPDGSTVVKIYYNRKTYLIKWDVKLNGEQEAYKEETLRYGAMPSYGEDPSKAPTDREVYSFSGWSPKPYAVDKDQIYNGSFNGSARPYTITWKDADGSALTPSTTNVQYGVSPTHDTPTPSQDNCNFTGWKASDGTIYDGELPTVGTNEVFAETYTAQYACTQPDIVVKSDESKIISNNTTTPATTVHVRGTLDVQNGVTLNTGDLILEGSADNNWNMSSGEIIGEGTVSATNAYYDMSPEGGYKERIWYAVAVPWEVSVPKNAVGDVYDADGHQLRLNLDFDLLYYNGESRATGGTNNWNSVAKDAEDKWVMKPGRAYMIYLAQPTAKLRFKKSSGFILTPSVDVKAYAETTNNNGKDANWNGIANPALYHAYLNAGTDGNYGQIFVPGNAQREGGRYLPVNMSVYDLVVGQPIFVQAKKDKDVTAYTSKDDYALHMPRRAQAEANAQSASYAVEIASEGMRGDRIFVATNDDKEDVYTIGQDVCKLGTSTTKPQMWVNRYDSKLCVNTMAFTAKKATYPLGISVPADGDYEIYAATEMQDGQEMYVTYNGRAIWNLAYGPYAATLTKGTHNEYGLKLVQKAPTITTGVDNAEGINDANGVRKVLIDDQIYIIREGVVYTINGQQVK